MKIEVEDYNGNSCELEIVRRDNKIELFLDDYCDNIAILFKNKEDIDLAIYELNKLRKEIYG